MLDHVFLSVSEIRRQRPGPGRIQPRVCLQELAALTMNTLRGGGLTGCAPVSPAAAASSPQEATSSSIWLIAVLAPSTTPISSTFCSPSAVSYVAT
ncbi:MAG: hypothetical protein QOG96_3315 [Pseudonocardiales bacterium]|jgi:hypothetical protein|nr:hypothetical protein [Pseudonocardiales bacterium]